MHELIQDISQTSIGRPLTALQVEAVVAAMTRPIVVIKGDAGSGTKQVLRVISRLWEDKGARILHLAGTGKAAKILTTMGMPAVTAHAALGWKAIPGTFEKGPFAPLDADVILVDEADMLPDHVLTLLVAARGEAPIILIRDPERMGTAIPDSPYDIEISH